MLNSGLAASVFWPLAIIVWPLAFLPFVAIFLAARSRKYIRMSNGGIKGMWKVWCCFCIGGLELAATLTFIVLLILGFLHGTMGGVVPSHDGRSVASIRNAELRMPAADNSPLLLQRVYLRIQGTQLPAGQKAQEVRIDNEDGECFFAHGGLVWSPDGRSVAFTNKQNDARRLWVVGMAAKLKRSPVAGDIHAFRWEDDSHLVFANGAGDIFRTAVSADGPIGEMKLLFSAGRLADAYQYDYHLDGAFDNPLSPKADRFLYGDRGSLTAVNLASPAIKKSFPVLGLPVRFWWNDAGNKCVVESMEGTNTGYENPPYHYYLYRTDNAALTLLASQSQAEAGASDDRIWFSDGRHFVLNSGYPAYMTWLVNTETLSAAWMEPEIKKLNDATTSLIPMVPLPLEHLERNAYKEPLPVPDVNADDFVEVEKRRNMRIEADSAGGVSISPSPRGDYFLVWGRYGQKDSSGNFVWRVIKLGSDSAGSISLVKKIAVPDPQSLYWKPDGQGFLSLKDQEFTFISAF